MGVGRGPGEAVRPSGRHSVVPHSRLSPWRSVRTRILLPVLLALAGVTALATIQTVDAARLAGQAERARTLTQVSSALAALAHEVVVEYVLTAAPRPEDGPEVLAQQRSATDAARVAYRQVGQPVLTAMPEVTVALREFTQALGGLTTARELAGTGAGDGSVSVESYYDQVLVTLVRLAGALPSSMPSKRLIELSDAMVTIAHLDWLGALQLTLIDRSLVGGELLGRDHVTLAGWVGAAGARVDSLRSLVPIGRLHTTLLRRPDVSAAVTIRQRLLDNPPGRVLPESADAQAWWTGQSRYLEGLRGLQDEVAALLAAEADALLRDARERAIAVASTAAVIAPADDRPEG